MIANNNEKKKSHTGHAKGRALMEGGIKTRSKEGKCV
jgi:hypothetical protein